MPRNDSVNDDLDDDDDDETDPSIAMKNMRRELRNLQKDNKELVVVRRENAMLKAGIDPTTKLGQMFAKSFDGDLGDIEAIKAEATEIGLLKPTPAADAATEPATNADGTPIPLDTSTEERRTLSSGALPEDGKDHSDPRATALTAAEARLKGGQSYEKAGAGYIAEIAARAMAGDKRVLVDQ